MTNKDLTRLGSGVVSARLPNTQIDELKRLARDYQSTPGEILRLAARAYTSGQPAQGSELVSRYLALPLDQIRPLTTLAAKTPAADASPLDGAGRSRKPLSPEEKAFIEQADLSEEEFFRMIDERIKSSRPAKASFRGDKPKPSKGREVLGTRRKPLTKLELDFCARENLSPEQFWAIAAAKRKAFRGGR